MVPLATLAADLRGLRRRLQVDARGAASRPPSDGKEWAAVLSAYDEALLAAAAMLEVPAPTLGPLRRLLNVRERRCLEESLAEAGLDVRQP